MGLLDKQSRIVDFQITKLGRKLLARGKLNFAYYRFFDDGVDYELGDDAIVNDISVDETASKSEYICKSSLSTLELDDPHKKPKMELSKSSMTLRKQLQIANSLAHIGLINVIDVYVEDEPQFETEPPVFYSPDQDGVGAYIPVVAEHGAVEGNATIAGTDFPVFEAVLEPTTAVFDGETINAVKEIDDPKTIGLQLLGATVKDGFRVEVFYSGTISSVSGSEDHLVKLKHQLEIRRR